MKEKQNRFVTLRTRTRSKQTSEYAEPLSGQYLTRRLTPKILLCRTFDITFSCWVCCFSRRLPRKDRERFRNLGTGCLAAPAKCQLGKSHRKRKTLFRTDQGHRRNADRRSDLRTAPQRTRKGRYPVGSLSFFRTPHLRQGAGAEFY